MEARGTQEFSAPHPGSRIEKQGGRGGKEIERILWISNTTPALRATHMGVLY
jgi:hypothetical protein